MDSSKTNSSIRFDPNNFRDWRSLRRKQIHVGTIIKKRKKMFKNEFWFRKLDGIKKNSIRQIVITRGTNGSIGVFSRSDFESNWTSHGNLWMKKRDVFVEEDIPLWPVKRLAASRLKSLRENVVAKIPDKLIEKYYRRIIERIKVPRLYIKKNSELLTG